MRARQGRGRDRRRQDAHARVRLGHHVHQPALPALPQPVGPGARPGRLQRRLRRGARDRRRGARARHRHRRLDPHPGRVLRRLRPEADVRPDPRHRRLPARPLARPRRPDGAHARRRPAVLRGADRRPRARPSRRSGSRSAPTCTLRALEPGIQRAFDAAAARARRLRGRRSRAPSASTPRSSRSRRSRPRSRTRDRSPRARDEYGPDVAHAARASRARSRSRTTPRRPSCASRSARSFARLFASADLLLTPIAGVPPEPIGDASQAFRDGVLPYTVPQDLAGLPSCAVPGRLRRARPAGRRAAHRPAAQRGPRARRRRGAVQRDSIGEGGIRVDPVTCGIRIPISILEAPAPVLARLQRADDRVRAATACARRVLVRRVVAAADVPAAPGRSAGAARRRRPPGSPRSPRPPPAAR